VTVIGEEGLSDADRRYLAFAERFERTFIGQGGVGGRSVTDTLDTAWDLLRLFPAEELTRIPTDLIGRYGGERE